MLRVDQARFHSWLRTLARSEMLELPVCLHV